MKKIERLIGIGIAILVCGVLFYFIAPRTLDLFSLIIRYTITTSERNDYTKITTPLPGNVVEDVCMKFDLDSHDQRCLFGSVVYGPDFFEDIKLYFRKLPDQEATQKTVQEKLGAYLVRCEKPDNEGYFRCRYDLRGDGLYPIFIHFTRDGYIYSVMANTGGS